MRRRLHTRQQRREQLLLRVDQRLAADVRQLVLVAHREGTRWAGLDAEAAQNATQVVDLVHASVALAGRETLFLCVVRALDVDRVSRAGPGTELASNALLEAVRVPVENVPTVPAGRGRLLLFGVLLGVDLLEHRREGDAEALDGVEDIAPAGRRAGVPRFTRGHWSPPRERDAPPCRQAVARVAVARGNRRRMRRTAALPAAAPSVPCARARRR